MNLIQTFQRQQIYNSLRRIQIENKKLGFIDLRAGALSCKKMHFFFNE